MFLIAHLSYIGAFLKSISFASLENIGESKKIFIGSASTIVLITFILNSIDLWEKTTNLTLFLLYGLILTIMVICAFLRIDSVQKKSFWLVIVGAVLFGISDNLLATLKFNHIHSDIGRAVIMLTYYSAQYLIVEGVKEEKMIK